MSLRDLEKELVGQRKWTLTGEVTAKKRPYNALLEEDIEFSRRTARITTTDQAPTTPPPSDDESGDKEVSLEDQLHLLIKRRICLQLFDNVMIKEDDPLPKKNHSTLPEEDEITQLETSKPKTSLVDQYTGADAKQLEKKVEQSQETAATLWKKLSYKLDSLVNYYHIPKPIT